MGKARTGHEEAAIPGTGCDAESFLLPPFLSLSAFLLLFLPIVKKKKPKLKHM